MTNDLEAIRKILKLHDELVARGVPIPEAYKRRDPEEPGREEKELAEAKLQRLVTQLFKEQEERIKQWLEKGFITRKQVQPPDPPDDIFDNEELRLALIALFIAFANQGVQITNIDSGDIIDTVALNGVVIDWASGFTTEWMAGLNETTRKALQKALELFITTPGMTIGEVIALLPFDKARAQMVATTEITNVFGTAAQFAGEQLARDNPNVRVIKTWFTNNDAIVRRCPVCWPLHGVSVKIKDDFIDGLGNKQVAPSAHPRGRCWMTVRTDITKSVELQKK